jgi:myosin-7
LKVVGLFDIQSVNLQSLAFGNAKTPTNDNSSRFGKYVKVFIDTNGFIKGAHIEKYMLEKQRLVDRPHDESNFHIFHVLFDGLTAQEKRELELGTTPNDYHLLSQMNNSVNQLTVNGLKESMKIVGFQAEEIWQIFSVLAALLHLGNLEYEGKVT